MNTSLRGLSLNQPWATLVAIGAKRYETRSWKTSHRGPIAIQAARSFPRDYQALCDVWPFAKYIGSANLLPRGVIVAVAVLQDIHPTAAIARSLNPDRLADAEELNFGDYTAGRWAWELTKVQRLKDPVFYWGHQGLWHVDHETTKMIKLQISEAA